MMMSTRRAAPAMAWARLCTRQWSCLKDCVVRPISDPKRPRSREAKMSLRAIICSRAFGRTSGQARIMTFLSLALFRLVHLRSRAAATRDNRGPSRSRRVANAAAFAAESNRGFTCRERPIEPFQQHPRSRPHGGDGRHRPAPLPRIRIRCSGNRRGIVVTNFSDDCDRNQARLSRPNFCSRTSTRAQQPSDSSF
jgi:hypothetical protein